MGQQIQSVVLLSGGLDSAANLALACARGSVKLAINVDYGQRAAAPELRAATDLAAYYGVPLKTISLSWLGELGGSALTDRRTAVPNLKTAELEDATLAQATARAVWVPNRNGVLLNVAAAVAEREGAGRVLVGFNREEAVTFADNSTEFLSALTRAFQFSTRTRVEAFCYTDRMDKTEIVASLMKLERRFPFELLWSCYQDRSEPCGECESCNRLSRALGANGVSESRKLRAQ